MNNQVPSLVYWKMGRGIKDNAIVGYRSMNSNGDIEYIPIGELEKTLRENPDSADISNSVFTNKIKEAKEILRLK